MRLAIEIEGQPERLALPDEGAALVAFLSFAVSRGFGAVHPAIALADQLSETRRIAWGPLTTFYEREPEDAEDREKLDLAWQPAGPLACAFRDLEAGLAGEAAALYLRRAGLDGLAEQAAAAAAALATVPPTQRVRLVYDL
jgi:hypothetical protein